MTRLTYLFVLLLFSIQAFSQEKINNIAVKYINSGSIKLDGKLEEPEWQSAEKGCDSNGNLFENLLSGSLYRGFFYRFDSTESLPYSQRTLQ